jgi:hypothetical protein
MWVWPWGLMVVIRVSWIILRCVLGKLKSGLSNKDSLCEAYFDVGSRTDKRVTFLCLGKEK